MKNLEIREWLRSRFLIWFVLMFGWKVKYNVINFFIKLCIFVRWVVCLNYVLMLILREKEIGIEGKLSRNFGEVIYFGVYMWVR